MRLDESFSPDPAGDIGRARSALSGKRLALITSQAFSIANFRAPLIREWISRGATVIAFAPDFDDYTRRVVEDLGAEPVDIKLSRTGVDPLLDVRDTLWLARTLRDQRIDVTFSYFIKPVIYGSLAARIAKVRHSFAMIEGAGYVFSNDRHGATRLGKACLRAVVSTLYRLALSRSDATYFLNREDIALFASRRMIDPRKAVLIGGIGVELAAFPASFPPLAPLTFLLAARLLEHKGIREFATAAARLRQRHPEIRCIVLGSPDLNPASVPEADLRRWHREGVIEWHPHVPDVRPWLRQSSVFVLPSWYREGVPRSIQEAMATGRAVITTNMPGCRDTIVDGESGLLVKPRDPDALYDAMVRFVREPALIASMGIAARRRAEELFDARRANRLILARMEAAFDHDR